MRRVFTPARLGALGLVVVAVFGVLYLAPSDDYLFLPSKAQRLAEKVRVQGERPDRDGGGIYYVEVHVRKASLLESRFPSIHEGSSLVPEHIYAPPGTSRKQRLQEDLQDMQRSQRIAAAVALAEAGYKVKIVPTGALVTTVFGDTPAAGKLRPGDVIVMVNGQRTKTPAALGKRIRSRPPGSTVRLRVRRGSRTIPLALRTIRDPDDATRPIVGIGIEQAATIKLPIKVDIDLGRVGGPSAGLAFALDILEELGRSVDRGRRIAATGEIALDGSVRPIGGVKQKTIGARRAGVDIFLVPAGENAAEARRHAGDMRIIPVKSFRQALRALTTGAEAS